MKSIRGKIMILFGMVGTICLLISLGISSVISYQLLERSQKDKYQYEAMKFGEQINGWFSKNLQIVDTIRMKALPLQEQMKMRFWFPTVQK